MIPLLCRTQTLNIFRFRWIEAEEEDIAPQTGGRDEVVDKVRDEEDREEVVVEVGFVVTVEIGLRTLAILDKMEDKAGDAADRLLEHQEFTDQFGTV